jgi:3-hydroxyisobutyrate dehydrogenase-like beta-hydroxyacid dehydrogenase
VAEVVGLLHPGEMGAAIGAILRGAGTTVLWASEGRGRETADRAAAAGLEDARTVGDLGARADVILSVCPPHAARDVLASVGDFDGLYVDANAVSPATARALAAEKPLFVDGGIIGPPPREAGTTRLYLSGPEAASVARLFDDTNVDARLLSTEVGDASALKMTYAAWSKGSAALLLAIRATARAEGIEDRLLSEWSLSIPGLEARSEGAERSAEAKGWRWVGEMEEIAATFGAAGQPEGFHRAAAEVFRRFS